MLEFLLRPEVAVFTGVFIVIACLLILEVCLLMIAGVGMTHFFEVIDTGDLPDTPITDFLHLKGIPLMMIIVIAAVGFALTGLGLHALSLWTGGTRMPAIMVYPISVAGGLLFLHAFGGLFELLKVESSTALSQVEFIGRQAEMLSELTTADRAGEAQFTDQYGQTHYVMVRPADGDTLIKGDLVVLIEQDNAFYNVQRVSA